MGRKFTLRTSRIFNTAASANLPTTLGMHPLRIARFVSLLGLLIMVLAHCQAQWATGIKSPCPERVPFKLIAGTTRVGKDLQETKRKSKAFGAIHTLGYAANQSGVYPGGARMRPTRRLTTTDPEFRKGSDHLISGTFRLYYRNGVLQQELVFKDGYILSDKTYYKNGNLMYWIDYDLDIDHCLFTCHVQRCLTKKGPLPTTEHILTYIDKRYGWHSPSYASTARWHDWKMECETWAQPLQFIQPGHTDSRIMAPERAVEAYFIRTDRSVMPAYAIVRLPSKRCLDRPFKVSGLEMSLTHTNGAPVQWTSVELVLPNSIPFAGLRSRKPALGRYHCFPLGKRTSFGYKAYDLKPGTYTMSIHYRANPVAAPVLIDQVPFGVSGN